MPIELAIAPLHAPAQMRAGGPAAGGVPLGAGPGGHTQRLLTVVQQGGERGDQRHRTLHGPASARRPPAGGAVAGDRSVDYTRGVAITSSFLGR